MGLCSPGIFGVLWNERNLRIFDNKVGEDCLHPWDKVKLWASLWASITADSKISLSFLFGLIRKLL